MSETEDPPEPMEVGENSVGLYKNIVARYGHCVYVKCVFMCTSVFMCVCEWRLFVYFPPSSHHCLSQCYDNIRICSLFVLCLYVKMCLNARISEEGVIRAI